jgi:hypothetical protein
MSTGWKNRHGKRALLAGSQEKYKDPSNCLKHEYVLFLLYYAYRQLGEELDTAEAALSALKQSMMIMIMIMMMISPFGQLGLWAPSPGV